MRTGPGSRSPVPMPPWVVGHGYPPGELVAPGSSTGEIVIESTIDWSSARSADESPGCAAASIAPSPL
jgi:hypothetical protein